MFLLQAAEEGFSFGFWDALQLLGALGFFIYGMKVMSEGIQKVAGSKLRQILSAMTKNRFLGVLTGLTITTIIQSSSASTVMTVSFVNAGLLSLIESIGVIMGANIGTTTTAWLVSYFGLIGKFKIAAYALPIIAVGFPMLFAKRSTLRSWAEFLIGFALLFLGLSALKDSVPDIKSNPEVLAWLSGFADMGFGSLLLFVAIGTVLTLIVQSSSAAMALTLVMCAEGWIPFEVATGMVLGENIGTTITANLAAMIGNVHAKRAARAHFIFNVFGVIWMLIAYKAFLPITVWLSDTLLGFGDPYTNAEHIPVNLSVFHTTFNIVNTFALVWFAGLIQKIVVKMVPAKGEDEQYHLEYIGTGLVDTPEIAILEAQKEIARFGTLTKKMVGFIPDLMQEKEPKGATQMLARIKKYEEITDRIEEEVGNYLLKVAASEISDTASLRVRSMLSIVGDLERIGDITYQMSKSVERKLDEKSWFTPEQRNNILEFYTLLDQALDIMVENLDNSYDDVNVPKAKDAENQINLFRNQLRKEHVKSIEQGDYNIRGGMIYADLFNSCEKLGDHIINVSEAAAGQT